MNIVSNIGQFGQTVEVGNYSATDLQHVYTISVDKTRYSELKKGYFLQAYYDESYYNTPEVIATGEQPRKFTRIINVVNNPTNTTWKDITTDAPILITPASGNFIRL